MRDHMEYYRAPAGSRDNARPGFGGAGWALAGAAGVAALAILGAQGLRQPRQERVGDNEGAKGWSEEPEVEYSITIERPAEELYRAWRDAATLPRIMGFLADIRPSGDGRSEWRADGPFGQNHAWAMEITEERPGELIRASSGDGGGALLTESEVVDDDGEVEQLGGMLGFGADTRGAGRAGRERHEHRADPRDPGRRIEDVVDRGIVEEVAELLLSRQILRDELADGLLEGLDRAHGEFP